jgi:hypothetical protein
MGLRSGSTMTAATSAPVGLFCGEELAPAVKPNCLAPHMIASVTRERL